MAYTKRFCWALIVCSIIILMPLKGWCLKLDPYQFHVIKGTIGFEYEKELEDRDDIEERQSGFTQIYRVDFLGNILSPELIIYDASIDYQREDTTINDTEEDNDLLNYSLSTTFLRNSRIPLTLFGSGYTSGFTRSSLDSATNGTIYGLDWSGKFRTLPVIHLRASRQENESDGTDTIETDYYLDMHKQLGPTDNRMSYSAYYNENKLTGDKSNSTGLNLFNTTFLTTHTILNIGATMSDTDGASSGSGTSYGLTLGVSSDPSRFFRQTHNLTYYKTDAGEDDFDGTNYTGALNYNISRKISSSLDLTVINTHEESVTSSEDTRSVNGNITFRYKITKRLSLSENIGYQHSEATSSGDTTSNLVDRDYLNVTTTLQYRRSLSWAKFSGSYGLGYVQDSDSSSGGGKGIQQTVSASLSNIDFNEYMLFNISASDTRIRKTEGGLRGNTNTFVLSTQNKKWKKYISLTGGYRKYSNKSSLTANEERNENIYFRTSTKFLRNTSFSLSYDNSKNFSNISGFSHSESGSFSAGHSRVFLGGRLGLTLVFYRTTSSSDGDESKSTSASYNLSYSRALLRRVSWNFSIRRSDSDSDGSKSNNTNMSNSLLYNLRAWQFSLNHYYSEEESSNSKRTDNRIVLRAKRSFVRMF